MFSNNPDVSFGDVNLSEEQIREGHNPGAGGWPTVKYFNKETGYGGKPYVKKTDASMCDELGDVKNMQACVEENGQTSLCSAASGAGCSEKENKFIATFKPKTAEEVTAQTTRLEGMASGKMTADLRTWLNQRLAILRQLAKGGAVKEEL